MEKKTGIRQRILNIAASALLAASLIPSGALGAYADEQEDVEAVDFAAIAVPVNGEATTRVIVKTECNGTPPVPIGDINEVSGSSVGIKGTNPEEAGIDMNIEAEEATELDSGIEDGYNVTSVQAIEGIPDEIATEPIVERIGDVFILEYDDPEEAAAAAERLDESCEYAEVDAEIRAAEDAPVSGDGNEATDRASDNSLQTEAVPSDAPASDAEIGQNDPSKVAESLDMPRSENEDDPDTPESEVNDDGQDGLIIHDDDIDITYTPSDDDDTTAGLPDDVDADENENEPVKIALVDSGVPEGASAVYDAISVIGDDACDRSGHAAAVLSCMSRQAPDAAVYSVRVLDEKNRGTAASVYAGIEAAIEEGVDIINLSVCGKATERSKAIADAVAEAREAGIVVVAAAGNEGEDVAGYVPAGLADAITAGSCDEEGVRLERSNKGDGVDVWVASDATSYAAATTTGWLAANSDLRVAREDLAAACGNGLFFASVAELEEEKPKEDGTIGEDEVSESGEDESTSTTSDEELDGGASASENENKSDDDSDALEAAATPIAVTSTELRSTAGVDRTDSSVPAQTISWTVDGLDPSNATFTTTNKKAFKSGPMRVYDMYSEDGYKTVPCVYTPNDKTASAWEPTGSFTLKWTNVARDAAGNRLDFALTGSNAKLYHGTAGAKLANNIVLVKYIEDSSDNDVLWVAADGSCDGVENTSAVGVKIKLTGKFTITGTDEPAQGQFLMEMTDIDQPDCSDGWAAASYNRPYAESVTLGDDFENDIYCQSTIPSSSSSVNPDPGPSLLVFDRAGRKIRGSESHSYEDQFRTGFVARSAGSEFSLTWRGSACATVIMQSYRGVRIYDKNDGSEAGLTDRGVISKSVDAYGSATGDTAQEKPYSASGNHGGKRTATTWRTTDMPWRGAAKYKITAEPGYRVSKVVVKEKRTSTSGWTTVATISGRKDVSGKIEFKATDNDTSKRTWATTRDYQIIVTTAKVSDASAQIRATKNLVGGTLLGSDFSFGLYTDAACKKPLRIDADGCIVGSGGTAVTAKNAADGSVTFPVIRYRFSGDAADYESPVTHTYYMREAAGKNTMRYEYDSSVKTITVTEGYDADTGKLTVTVTGNNPTFVNTYKRLGGVSASKTDSQTGEPLSGATFTIYRMPASTNLATLTYDAVRDAGEKEAIITSASDGVATTSADALAADESKYAVIETAAPSGYKVNATWVGTATLTEDNVIVPVSGGACTDTPSPGTAAIKARKRLEGKELRAGEFEFLLEAITPGAPMPETAIATNDADGVVSWSGIEYTSTGSFVYKISEIAGSDDPQMTWDETEHYVTVSVTSSDGIRAMVSYDTTADGEGGSPTPSTFTNVFEPRCGVRVAKVDHANGSPLAGAEFEIVGDEAGAYLYDAGGNRVESLTITSGEDGYASTPRQTREIDGSGIEEVDGALVSGKRYKIRESRAPEGYGIDSPLWMPFTAGRGTLVEPGEPSSGIQMTAASIASGIESAIPVTAGAQIDSASTAKALRLSSRALADALENDGKPISTETDLDDEQTEYSPAALDEHGRGFLLNLANEASINDSDCAPDAAELTTNDAAAEFTYDGSSEGAARDNRNDIDEFRAAADNTPTRATITPTYYDLTNGTYYIRDTASTGYVVAAASATEGAAVSSKAYSATSRLQQWKITKVTDVGSNNNTYKILCASNDTYGLAVGSGGTQANGTKMILSEYKGYRYHKLFIDKNANSSASFFPPFATNVVYCMDVTEGAYNGGRLQIWECTRNSGDSFGTRNAAQQFTLERVYYNVKFNANGGSGSMSNQKIWMDKATALTSNGFTRTGYKFAGWNTKADGTGDPYGNAASVTNLTTTHEKTVNLYAQWTPCKMTIRYHVNGGTIATDTSAATRYRASSGIAQRSTDGGSTWANITTSINTEATYQNLWDVGTFPITRTGYHVVGTKAWNTKADGTGVDLNQGNTAATDANPVTTRRINGGTQISADTSVTLYANWVANTYSVRYNGNGATSGAMANSSHVYGTAKALTQNGYSKTGYAFAGWAITQAAADAGTVAYADGQSVTSLTASNGATVDLYAVWAPATYSIAYANVDGASLGASHPASATYDAAFTVDAPTHNEGKAFLGWDISGMDDTVHVVGGESTNEQTMTNVMATGFKNLRATPGTVTFTAVWEGEYEPDGGLYDIGAVYRDSRLEASVSIGGRKYLREVTGRGATSASNPEVGEFSFELLDSDGRVISTAVNDADGRFQFGPIEYDHTDIGKTYHYTVREVDTSEAGMTYDTEECQVRVAVVQDGQSMRAQTHYSQSEQFCDLWDLETDGAEVYATGLGTSADGAFQNALEQLQEQTDDGTGCYSIESEMPSEGSGTLTAYWRDHGSEAFDHGRSLELGYLFGVQMNSLAGAAFENTHTPSYDAEVVKVDADDPGEGLAGAAFTVYEWDGVTSGNGEVPIPTAFSSRAAFDAAFEADASSQSLAANASGLTASGLAPVTSIVTDASGRASTSGGALSAGKTYFVVETRAPAGHELRGYSDAAPDVLVGVLRDYTDGGGLPRDDATYTSPSSGGQVAMGNMIAISASSATAAPLSALVWEDPRVDAPLGGIRVTKVDASDGATGLPGAWFNVYDGAAFSTAYESWKAENPNGADSAFLAAICSPAAGEDGNDPDPLFLEPVAEICSGEGGVAQTGARELPTGKAYRVVEISAPSGYSLPEHDFSRPNAPGSGNMTVEVAEEGALAGANTDGDDAAFPDEALDLRGEASLVAYKTLDGARLEEGRFTFQLLNEGGEVLQTKANAAPASAGQAGRVEFDPIEYGPADKGLHVYFIREVVPAGVVGVDGAGGQVATWEGATDEQKANPEISWRLYDGASWTAYDVAERRVTVAVYDDGAGSLACEVRGNGPTFDNEAYVPRQDDAFGGVRAKKVAAGTGEPLAGAVFRVESLDTGATWDLPSTGSDGCAATGDADLPAGSYRVTELEPPEGYRLNADWSVTFSIASDGDFVDLSQGPDANLCTDELDIGPVFLPLTGGNGVALVSVAAFAAVTLGLAIRKTPEMRKRGRR